MDLERHAARLREVEEQLQALARPVRRRYERLGPAGLYALAAAELRLAAITRDDTARRVHESAAAAAETLADRAVARGLPVPPPE